MPEQRTRSLDRRYRRALRWGLALSFAAHALLLVVFDAQTIPPSPFAAAGERRGDARAAAGGGMEAVELRSPAEPATSPPEEVPAEVAEVELEPPEPTIEDMGLPSVRLAEALTIPGPVSTLRRPGLRDGTGEGDGGTEAEGRFRVVPPRPRGMILPPADRPDRVRGKEVDVWVFVSAAGTVVPDSTRLDPPTGDRGFDRRLREHAAAWRFEAARRDGNPVAEWFRYTIIM